MNATIITKALATLKNEIISGIQAFIGLCTADANSTTVLHPNYLYEEDVRGSGLYQEVKIIYSKIVNFSTLCIFMYYLYFLSQNN